jgi:hypothetical protein
MGYKKETEMKITKSQLKQIIKEELNELNKEMRPLREAEEKPDKVEELANLLQDEFTSAGRALDWMTSSEIARNIVAWFTDEGGEAADPSAEQQRADDEIMLINKRMSGKSLSPEEQKRHEEYEKISKERGSPLGAMSPWPRP